MEDIPDDQVDRVPSTSADPNSRKLRILWAVLVGYFVVMMVGLSYAPRAPYQLVVIGGLLNFAILAVIVTPIIRVYRQRGGALALPSGSALSTERDARRLWMLWIGLFLYGIITLNSFRFLVEAPPRLLIAVVAGVLVNVGMLVAFVVAIRRVSKRLKK